MQNTIKWVNEKRKVQDLIPAKYNPRKWPEKETEELRNSIEKFSLADPLIINKNNTVIGGHFRLNVLKEKGLGEVDVRVPDRLLDDAEERELNLRLNRNLGLWDYDALAAFDEDMLKDVGFESKELDKIFQLEKGDEDDVPDLRAKTNIKSGEIYALGEHQLMCGDSCKRKDVERLMGQDRAHIVFTDPPYGVSYDTSKYSAKVARSSKHWASIKNDDLKEDSLFDFIVVFLALIKEFSIQNPSYYICFSDRNLYVLQLAFKELEIHFTVPLIWVKQSAPPTWDRYHPKHEVILFGGEGSKPTGKKSRWFGDRCQTTVWEIDRDVTKEYKHPTQKPVALIEKALINSSQRGEIVLDLFGGSGSTLLACEKNSRKCRMMEIEPFYCQVIIDRWEQFTGKKAKKIND